LNSETVGNIYIPYPPLPEQEAIASFLDDKCAKIDELVAIKEQQIDKLKELRQVKIHQAVTKGINPNVEMKDSGIDWIGEIPKHWEVKKVKHFGTIKSGDSIINSYLSEYGKYEVFGGNGFIGYYNNFNSKGERIIIGRVGALCGNVRYINEEKWIADDALILTLNDKKMYPYF